MEIQLFRGKGVLADPVSSVSVLFSFFIFRKSFWNFTDPLKNNIKWSQVTTDTSRFKRYEV